MPVCLHCNRKFANKEALHQHIKSSSVEHPYCSPCDRRFISQAACDAHMAAKHPPTYECDVCTRSFPALFALEDHYRGSPSHPNCSKCGRGFKDNVERDSHHQTAHPQVSCDPCGSILIYEETLENHYHQSSNHPSCKPCNRGFKDDSEHAEHVELVHLELRCEPCERRFETPEAVQNHYFASANHPECTLCNRGYKDEQEYRAHMETHGLIANIKPDINFVSTGSVHGFSPLSPKTFQELVIGDAMKDPILSPALSLQMNYSSPIKDVQGPIFSPLTLPRPGRIVEEVWAARDNVQATFSRAPQRPSNLNESARISPSLDCSPMDSLEQKKTNHPSINEYIPRRLSDPVSQEEKFVVSNLRPRASYATGNGKDTQPQVDQIPPWRSRNPRPLNGATQFSDAQAARQFSTSMKYGLYPGSGSGISRLAPGGYQPPGRFSRMNNRAPLDPSSNHADGNSQVNWRELLGEKVPVQRDPESSFSDDLSTQAVDTPIQHSATLNEISPGDSGIPGSSFSPWTAQLPPSISSSSKRSSEGPSSMSFSHSGYSRSSHSQSPEIFSPIGLAALPVVSPLATTPVDIPFANFKLEADSHTHKPVNDLQGSPLHLAIDTRLPESPTISSLISSQQSRVTSPQESNWDDSLHESILSLRLPDSPAIEAATSSAVASQAHLGDTSGSTEKLSVHITPAKMGKFTRETAVDHERQSTKPTNIPLATKSPPKSRTTPSQRLHCRLCQLDPCKDLTATMCGHIFCYRCITDEVIKNSRCPVCTTPTLLYCLFRINLSV